MSGLFDNMDMSGYVSAGGTLLSSYGKFSEGNAILQRGEEENAAAQYSAIQMRQNAGQAQASAQRSAESQGVNTQLMLSHGLAAAAAGGGGATDPTVVNLMARVAGEGAYRQAVALYQGNDKARTLNMQADATEYSGQVALENAKATRTASGIGAVTSLLKGGTSLYSKYSGGGPDVGSDVGSAGGYASNDFLTS